MHHVAASLREPQYRPFLAQPKNRLKENLNLERPYVNLGTFNKGIGLMKYDDITGGNLF